MNHYIVKTIILLSLVLSLGSGLGGVGFKFSGKKMISSGQVLKIQNKLDGITFVLVVPSGTIVDQIVGKKFDIQIGEITKSFMVPSKVIKVNWLDRQGHPVSYIFAGMSGNSGVGYGKTFKINKFKKGQTISIRHQFPKGVKVAASWVGQAMILPKNPAIL